MSEFKRYLREHAERELQLAGFMETEFGATCLEFLEGLANVADSDAESMKAVCEMLIRLISCRPITPITEDDFDCVPDNKGRYVCIRYPYIYRHNGKIYNDRHYGFILDDANKCVYIYAGEKTSKQEISLPYTVVDRIKSYN